MNLLTIQIFKDSTAARSFLNYLTFEAATSALYSTMASACINENIQTCICMLIGDNGVIYKQEIYDIGDPPNPMNDMELINE